MGAQIARDRGSKSRVRVTHLWGQMHEQHSSYRSLSLAISLLWPVQGVGLENLQQPLLPVPEDLIKASLPGNPSLPSVASAQAVVPPSSKDIKLGLKSLA